MNLLTLVVSMGIVTYIPRMLPLVLLKNSNLPIYVRKLMKCLPYSVLGALIFPGVLYSTGADTLKSAIVGCIMSMLLAYFELNLVLVVIGGILGAFFMSILSL